MKKKLSKVLAGILAAACIISSGDYRVYASEKVISVEGTKTEEGNTDTDQPEGTTPETEGQTDPNTPSNTEGQQPGTEDPIDNNVRTDSEDPLDTNGQTGSGESTDPNGEANEEGQSDPEGQPDTPNSINIMDENASPVSGSIEVRLIAGMEVNVDQTFEVGLKLKGSELGESSQITLPGQSSRTGLKEQDGRGASEGSHRFSNLNNGEYVLTISRKGYVPYIQNINVENMGYRVQVYAGRVPVIEGSGAKPGLIVCGDVNSDGSLDEQDDSIIVDAIEQYSNNQTYNALCDLNGDQKIDLVDLNYFTAMEAMEQSKSSLEKLIPQEAFQTVLAENTDIDGELSDLLSGKNDGVTLMTKGGNPVSRDNPLEIGFDFSKSTDVKMGGIVIESPKGSENLIEAGQVTVIYDKDGVQTEETIDFSAPAGLRLLSAPAQINNFQAKWDKNGTLCIDLGSQIAVKYVVFKITKTSSNLNLAEISRVEFVNDMASRIPEPSADTPTGLVAEAGNKFFTLTWNKATNVTGYEVFISSGGKTDYRKTTQTTLDIRQFAGDKMENGTEYLVCVRSTNGEWKSAYSAEVPVTPKVDRAPEAPTEVTINGGYRSIDVRWKNVKDADNYNLFWKEDGAGEYQKVTGIEGLYYHIEGLKDNTTYAVYLTASNEVGEGAKSDVAKGKTISGLVDAKLPAYKLINTSNGNGVLSAHIKTATIGGLGVMVDSPLDKEKNQALGLFDNNYSSYVQCEDWDYGGAYPDNVKGVTTELDAVYDLGMIAFAEPMDLGAYSYLTVQYWDEAGKKNTATNVTFLKKRSNNRDYYLIKFKDPIRTSKVQLGIGRYNAGLRKVTISEIRFYEYDTIEQDIMNLYTDDLHIFLREDVTIDTIQELNNRLDTKDPVSGEYHPERDTLLKELDTARKLLETGGLGGVLQVNPSITREKDKSISVGGLNSWQPLGVTAAAGDKLVVYVGGQGMKEGASTRLNLVFTQQHADSGKLSATKALKIGRNEIDVPEITSLDKERGGALYIQYTGNNPKDQYAVRVSGGSTYPILNLYGVTGEERTQRIATYVQELRTYVAELEDKHSELHQGNENDHVNYGYKATDCILNMTDIQMDQMMLSIPASQVWKGLGDGGAEDKLASTVQAMENMMLLFYQHKGLTNSFAEGTAQSVIDKNHLPYQYLNIRYMKMFPGAFMYAAGNHIGIEWNETAGLMGGVPVVSDENGKYQSGSYYGWGIAHEIGHEINQGAYAYAEVTNNYFSVLAQAKDSNSSVRFQYPEVFKKVTSGTTGYANNVFTQLGMYWQLHLAYDRDYNYKTYPTYQDTFENLFFARVDSYARDTSLAPQPGGVGLTLTESRDQNLMRLASAAAERDLSEFFIRWGMVPDTATTAYMGQFAKEERAIYYVDDTARVYEIEHSGGNGFAKKDVVTAEISANNSEVTLTMTSTFGADLLQGYEITRVWTEDGKERREIAGFTQESTFTDYVAFASNHVLQYEVTAIDKYLNRSNGYQAGAVKIKGDGLQDKTSWTAKTNMVSPSDSKPDGTEENPCEPETISAVVKTIDNKKDTTFAGTATGEDPYIILELGHSTEVTALNYILSGSGQAITDYKIEISQDGQSYREVKVGTFNLNQGSSMVYFENGQDPWVCTYDATYVKLTAVGQKGKEISISELELYGPAGDNVEFLSSGSGDPCIGTLSSDYIYDKAAGKKIPKGSMIFTGNYKGNPAYNVVVLYDENGVIVGGQDTEGNVMAHQIILAEDPGNAMLGETSDGTFIYWIEPEELKDMTSLPKKVRAELYRVDNAWNNQGQRLVSDTEFINVPQNLPPISIKQ